MHRRKWDAKTKAMIVIEGLRGKPAAEICTEHHMSQVQYYQWRDGAIGFWPMRPRLLKSMSIISKKPAWNRRTAG
jgi:Transposase